MSVNWSTEIELYETFAQDMFEHGRKVYDRYLDEREGAEGRVKKANFFYANVNTQRESLFNSLPKPDVSRRHKGNYDDDVARVASLIMQRALSYEIDCAEGFEESISLAILDRLVPGIGTVWVRFESNPEEPGSEKLFVDQVYWEDFLYSPSRSWQGVWWVGRRHSFTKEEMDKKFPDWGVEGAESSSGDDNTPKEITQNKFWVYEIWNKRDRTVSFVLKGRSEPLKSSEDPYKLKKFFPCPKPLIANVTGKKFLPTTDYYLAQDQYDQLNVLYGRIQLIVEAVKVAGLYDGSAPEIGKMLSGRENTLIPVDNWAMFAERGGSKGMIDWYPVETIIAVLQQLQGQLEVSKQVLYEITGMSDIVRGASNQYETASAQQIKAQFASVRLTGGQNQVSKFVSEVLNIMGSIIAELFSNEKIAEMVMPLSEADLPFAEDAMKLLRNELSVMYRVRIEANSLTQADWALEKEQRMEAVTNIGNMLGSALALVEKVPEMGVLSAQLIKFAISGLKGAAEIEGWLDQQLDMMLRQQQEAKDQPPEPSPEQQKMQMEMQMKQQDAQMKQQTEQQKLELDQQRAQFEMQMEQRMAELEFSSKQRMAELDMQIKEMELQYQMQKNQMDLQQMQVKGAIQTEQARASGEQKLELAERQHEMKEKQKGEEDADVSGDM